MKGTKLATLAVLCAFLGMVALWGFGSLMARPANGPVAPAGPPAEVVSLRSNDGVPLEGSYWPGASPSAPAILLLHGIDASREMFNEQGRWLNGLGYTVLAIDFRGHGGSGAEERTYGWNEAKDAEAAFEYLRKEMPGRKVGVIGVSMGGAAALLGEKGPLPADALVLNAVYPDLRTAIRNRLGRVGIPVVAALSEPLLSYQSYLRYGIAPDLIAPRDGLRRFGGPVLVIGGGEDRYTSVGDTRAVHRAAAGPKSLWIVAGADHVEVCKLFSDEYRARIRRFLAITVGEPSSTVQASA